MASHEATGGFGWRIFVRTFDGVRLLGSHLKNRLHHMIGLFPDRAHEQRSMSATR